MKMLKNLKKNTILLFLITIIVLYIVLKDDFNEIVNAFHHLNFIYIIIAIIFYLISIVIKGYVNYIIVNNKDKISLKESIKHNIITQFFNGVTPFSTGGQPMEIYMLTEHNIPLAKATNYTIQSFIFYQIALVICGTFAVLYNFIFHIFPKVKLLQHFVVLGFIINIAVVIVLLLISYSKYITNKISIIIIKILKKIKKNVNEEEIKNKINEFYNGFQSMKKNKRLIVSGIVLNIASLLCLYCIPIFIVYSMGDFTSLSISDTITSSAYVYLVGAFVPIPGASGGIEYGFTQFFGNFLEEGLLKAVLLIWRSLTYYLGVIIGAIIFNMEKKVEK